ncbi:MAG: hypothetical protein RL274_1037 [Pseudomonadota bacterium]|jgi:hypothetical protein
MKNQISIRAALVVIAAEAVFIACIVWAYAGLPGARLDTGAPSITIRFEPPPNNAYQHAGSQWPKFSGPVPRAVRPTAYLLAATSRPARPI